MQELIDLTWLIYLILLFKASLHSAIITIPCLVDRAAWPLLPRLAFSVYHTMQN